jgi:hypothetical protein
MDQLRFGWIRKSENKNWNDGFTILELRCRIYDLRFWIYDFGFWILDFGFMNFVLP